MLDAERLVDCWSYRQHHGATTMLKVAIDTLCRLTMKGNTYEAFSCEDDARFADTNEFVDCKCILNFFNRS